MAYKSLSHFIDVLESAGELVRIKEFVSPRLEISEITDRVVKSGGKALLFENNGSAFPLLINAYGSERRMCLALGVKSLDDIGHDIECMFNEFLGPRKSFLDKLKILPALQTAVSWMPHLTVGRGVCQEVVMTVPDLTRLPILTCWPADGGPFITLPSVHTKDPISGIRNLGMYRMQLFGADLTGMHWHLHKGAAQHYQQYRELKRRMPVTVTLGGDPVYTYVATSPLPENMDEYLLAGFLRKKRVELVKCLTNNLEIPADVDFVIEGFVDPGEELILEGPFGDHTGFYSLADFFPRFHVTCITHRKGAVYPATVVGIPPQEDGWIGKATERIFLAPIKMAVAPEIVDMHMPVEGVFHNIALVGVRKNYPGQALKMMNSLWGAGQMMFNKILVALDAGTTLTDYWQVARIISEKADPLNDFQFVKGPVDILDHSSNRYAFGSKIGIDATTKLNQETPAPIPNGESCVDAGRIKAAFPEVVAINDKLLSLGISALIVSIKKDRPHQIRQLASDLIAQGAIRGMKFILVLDAGINIADLSSVVWIFANNIDPIRDCFFVETAPGIKYPGVFIDGTRKTAPLDGFERSWPNIIVMDEETIRSVDQKWNRLGLGPLIPSPSLGFKSLISNSGAMAE